MTDNHTLTDADKDRIKEAFHEAFPLSSGSGFNEFYTAAEYATIFERQQQAKVDLNQSYAQIAGEVNALIDVIKNLVYRSLQWEDGEIKGYDEQMIEALTPILLKPFISNAFEAGKLAERTDLLAKVSEQEKEIERLKEEREVFCDRIRVLDKTLKENHEQGQQLWEQQAKRIEELETEKTELVEKMAELLKAFNDSDKNYTEWVATNELYSAFTGVNNLLERLNK